VKGTRLVFYRDIPYLWFISASFAEVLIQLADGCPPRCFLLRRHWSLRINEVRRANPEPDISVPPQLNKIAKSVNRILPITPKRLNSEGTYLFEFLVQRDKNGRVRERQ
jgi:hypothetical protein